MIPLFRVNMAETVDAPLLECLHSGYIGQGKAVDKFEADLAAFIGNPRVLTTNSGTSALHLALHMIGVEGKHVITTALTCTATNWPIISNGGKILWADIEGSSPNISVRSVEKLLEEYRGTVAAVMVVHWGGSPVDIEGINQAAAKYGVPVIEDSAHALGSEYHGQKIGNHSRFVCFSFQAIKHLTTVDGGLICLSSNDDYQRAKLLRWYGIDRDSARADLRCEDDVLEAGFKFHMNDVCATIGCENLKLIPAILEQSQAVAAFYSQHLANMPGVRLMSDPPNTRSSYWLYTIAVENRDGFMRHMKDCGVMTSKVHARNDLHTCVKEFVRPLPVLDAFTKQMVCIPASCSLEEAKHVVDCIKRGWS